MTAWVVIYYELPTRISNTPKYQSAGKIKVLSNYFVREELFKSTQVASRYLPGVYSLPPKPLDHLSLLIAYLLKD